MSALLDLAEQIRQQADALECRLAAAPGVGKLTRAKLIEFSQAAGFCPGRRDRVLRLFDMQERGDFGRLPEEVAGQPFRCGCGCSDQWSTVVDRVARTLDTRTEPAPDRLNLREGGIGVPLAPLDQAQAKDVEAGVFSSGDQAPDDLFSVSEPSRHVEGVSHSNLSCGLQPGDDAESRAGGTSLATEPRP